MKSRKLEDGNFELVLTPREALVISTVLGTSVGGEPTFADWSALDDLMLAEFGEESVVRADQAVADRGIVVDPPTIVRAAGLDSESPAAA